MVEAEATTDLKAMGKFTLIKIKLIPSTLHALAKQFHSIVYDLLFSQYHTALP